MQTDAVVIGAGPVGLFQVFQLGLQGLACHVIDALPHAGGQCAELYGDKPIYDIPGIQVCTGQELTNRLLAQIAPFAPQWHLGEQATVLQPQADGSGFLVETAQGTRLHTRTVFVAAGVGAFVPRTLKAPGLDAFEGMAGVPWPGLRLSAAGPWSCRAGRSIRRRPAGRPCAW